MAVFCSASSFSASARSRLALSMASTMAFSRPSTADSSGPQANFLSRTATMRKVIQVQMMRPGLTSVKAFEASSSEFMKVSGR